jgi:hypothetical protein
MPKHYFWRLNVYVCASLQVGTWHTGGGAPPPQPTTRASASAPTSLPVSGAREVGGKSLASIHLLGRPHTRGGHQMVNRPTTRGALEPPLYSPTPGLTVPPSCYPSHHPLVLCVLILCLFASRCSRGRSEIATIVSLSNEGNASRGYATRGRLATRPRRCSHVPAASLVVCSRVYDRILPIKAGNSPTPLLTNSLFRPQTTGYWWLTQEVDVIEQLGTVYSDTLRPPPSFEHLIRSPDHPHAHHPHARQYHPQQRSVMSMDRYLTPVDPEVEPHEGARQSSLAHASRPLRGTYDQLRISVRQTHHYDFKLATDPPGSISVSQLGVPGSPWHFSG